MLRGYEEGIETFESIVGFKYAMGVWGGDYYRIVCSF